MRSFLIAAAAALSTLPSPRADACGSYMPEPTVMMVSTHFIPGEAGDDRQRAFVILGEPAPDGLAWAPLAPDSYDHTKIASAPSLAQPIEVTLVGPSGTRTVKLRERVYLAGSKWRFGRPTTAALEVKLAPGERFAIAIAGPARADWLALDDSFGAHEEVPVAAFAHRGLTWLVTWTADGYLSTRAVGAAPAIKARAAGTATARR